MLILACSLYILLDNYLSEMQSSCQSVEVCLLSWLLLFKGNFQDTLRVWLERPDAIELKPG